ncbi:hypothetical protein ACFV3E_29395 [Streptomyces sp. NPDC059718]
MDDKTRMHRPGEMVLVKGVYECTCGKGHRFAGMDVHGHTFPPVPSACSGAGWDLLTPVHAERSP